MDEERGARMFFDKINEAEHFRMRANYARVLHRNENKKIHDPGTPLYGKSEYDVIVFTIKTSEDGFWVYAQKSVLDTSRVEPIPAEDAPAIYSPQETTDDNQTTT